MDHQAILAYVIGRLVIYYRDIHDKMEYPNTNDLQFQMDLHDTMTLASEYLNGRITALGPQYSDIQVNIVSDLKLMNDKLNRN